MRVGGRSAMMGDQVTASILGFRWDYINGLMLSVIYGGRVDNDFDLRTLQSYLDQYLSPATLGQHKAMLCPDVVIPLSNNIQVIPGFF